MEHAPIANRTANKILVRHAIREWFINTLPNCILLARRRDLAPRIAHAVLHRRVSSQFHGKGDYTSGASENCRCNAFLTELLAVRDSPRGYDPVTVVECDTEGGKKAMKKRKGRLSSNFHRAVSRFRESCGAGVGYASACPGERSSPARGEASGYRCAIWKDTEVSSGPCGSVKSE